MIAPIRYRSTRGHGPVGLAAALEEGLAPDGGLYLPESLPRVPLPVAGPLQQIGPGTVAPFLPDGDAGPVAGAFSFDTPLVPLAPGRYLLDLTRGPTAAFKDVGARFLARALSTLAPMEDGSSRTVLVATSGDTGGAVAAAFHGVPGLRVAVLFPADGVSSRQRRQFTTLGSDVLALGVDGPFDDCQRLVKEALAHRALARDHHLTSANSINIGRLLPQATWFVKALADLAPGDARPVTFVVPSGNLGHVTAGLMASAMTGTEPLFVAAVNDNDRFAAWLDDRPPTHEGTVATPSTAMDVGRPSNLERIEAWLGRHPQVRARISAEVVGAEETMAEMRRIHDESGRFVDPHTAVGLVAARRRQASGGVPGAVVVLATADAGKFPDTVRRATGSLPPVPPALAGLDESTEHWTPLPSSLPALADVLAEWPSTP